jgi:hypothetical protein
MEKFIKVHRAYSDVLFIKASSVLSVEGSDKTIRLCYIDHDGKLQEQYLDEKFHNLAWCEWALGLSQPPKPEVES